MGTVRKKKKKNPDKLDNYNPFVGRTMVTEYDILALLMKKAL